MTEYDERVRLQINQYANTLNMHELPEIFHFWSNNYLLAGLRDIFSAKTIEDIYINAISESRINKSATTKILSIGCGDGSLEIKIAKALINSGMTDFQYVCADLSPILLGNMRNELERENIAGYFIILEVDLNKIEVQGKFDVIMAHHSLHHIENLELLFDYSFSRLENQGIFVTCDVIGRNGHQRWPEVTAFVQAVWPLLKPIQKYHAQLDRYSEIFIDHDCSKEGFEGIRAQDVLPELLKRFHSYRFYATGGLIDLFVDRGYGHGFDTKNPEDVAFIKYIADLNEILLDAGVVKPTMVFGYFTKTYKDEICVKQRSARNSVRDPTASPQWAQYHDLKIL